MGSNNTVRESYTMINMQELFNTHEDQATDTSQ